MGNKYITRKHIISAIIVGIIVYILCYVLVRPLMDFLIPKLLSISSRCGSFFTNIIYRRAAMMDTSNFDTTIFMTIMSVFVTTAVMALIISFKISSDISAHAFNENRRPPIWKIRCMALLLIFLVVLLCFPHYAEYFLNLHFNQRLTVLAPYLSDQQEEELKSQWTLMKNEDDYKRINDILWNFAQKNNIKEPKIFWKSR